MTSVASDAIEPERSARKRSRSERAQRAAGERSRRIGSSSAAAAGRCVRAALTCLAILMASDARPAEDAVLAPLLDVVVLEREILAIDAESGGETRERLEIGERVLFAKQRGKVGVAVTDRRILAVATRSGSWQEARYRVGETPPQEAGLGDRVALVLTAQRAIGFDGGSGNLVESSIGPQELATQSAVGQNVAVVITNRRALGLSSDRGGFFETRLRLGERVQSISALAKTVTLHTDRRLLIFRGPSGSWEERRLPLR
jgi:hypothetical protein